MFWRALSLRSKLLFLALAGLLTVAVVSFIQMNQGFQVRQAAVRNDFKQRASLVSQNISSRFSERYRDIQSFSMNTVFQSGQKEKITEYLNSIVSVYQVYDSVVLVDFEGRFVASNNKTHDGRILDVKAIEGRSYSDTSWFAKAVKGEWSEDKARGYTGAVVEDLQIDPVSSALHSATLHGMSFSRPVVNAEGRVAGVLTARASVRFIENELRSFFEILQSSGLRSAQIMLLNKEGLVGAEASADLLAENGTLKRNPERVLRWNLATQQGQLAAQEALAGKSGSLIEIDRVGRNERIWGFAPLRDWALPEYLNWSVVVSVNTEDVISDLFTQRRIFYPMLFVFVLVFGLTGYGIARSLTREYHELSTKIKDETIRIVEVGDELVQFCEKTGQYEGSRAAAAGKMIEKSTALAGTSESRSAALTECITVLGEFEAEVANNRSAVQKGLTELKEASGKFQDLQRILDIVTEMKSRVSALNEIVFRVQLVGFNATIESNRAGPSGRAFAGVAQEIQSFSEHTEKLARELSEQLARLQMQTDEITAASAMRIGSAEKIFSDSIRIASQSSRNFPKVTETLGETIKFIREQDDNFRSVAESVEGLETAVRKSMHAGSDVVRKAREVREQIYFLEDAAQDFSHAVKGLRARSRLKRSSAQSVFTHSNEVSPERARADAVDRLAQKMRPRLVVKPDDHEPEVSEGFDSDDTPRNAG
ncbi:MAG: hypothetical protein EBR09_13520 [Proteobacteria bacterium]|nr:hypothetical protein [Pseudomonadota bacterium]